MLILKGTSPWDEELLTNCKIVGRCLFLAEFQMEFLSRNCFGTSNFLLGMWKGNDLFKRQLQEQKFHKNPRGEHKVTTDTQNEYFRENPPTLGKIPLRGWWDFQQRPGMGEAPVWAWELMSRDRNSIKIPVEWTQSGHGHSQWVFWGKFTYFRGNPPQGMVGFPAEAQERWSTCVGLGIIPHPCVVLEIDVPRHIFHKKTHGLNTKWIF